MEFQINNIGSRYETLDFFNGWLSHEPALKIINSREKTLSIFSFQALCSNCLDKSAKLTINIAIFCFAFDILILDHFQELKKFQVSSAKVIYRHKHLNSNYIWQNFIFLDIFSHIYPRTLKH